MKKLLDGLFEIDSEMEFKLLELVENLEPHAVAAVISEELGLNSLYERILHSRVLDMQAGR